MPANQMPDQASVWLRSRPGAAPTKPANPVGAGHARESDARPSIGAATFAAGDRSYR